MSARCCCKCGALHGVGRRECRPYGPGGADICFACATGDPVLEAEAKRNFGARLAAAEAQSPMRVAVLDGDGVSPMPRPEKN